LATIVDVARRAGVSVATVSRVLNGSGYADPATRTRVQQAVADLGYQRNIHWSRLKSRSSRTILFLLGNRDGFNPMHMRLLMACERVFQAHRYDLIFARHEYPAAARPPELVLPSVLQQSGAVDGVVLAGVHYPNLLGVLEKRKLPYALLANDLPGPTPPHNCILYDDRTAMDEATCYLQRLGHRRIAYVGNRTLVWFERRFQGYQAAMERHALPTSGVFENWTLANHDYGQLAAAQLLKEKPAPTAIIAGNDELAAGVWKELTKRRIAIPGQISLMGVGDRVEYLVLEPALTSISVFADQLGERLATMLLSRVAGPGASVPTETLPCKLMERASCGPRPEPRVMALRMSS